MTVPLRQSITVVVRTISGGRDAYGSDVPSTSTTTVDGVFAPGGSAEIVQGGDVVTTQPTVYLPSSVDVTAIDAITVGGVTYEVDGDPQVWGQHPITGWKPSLPVVVALRKVTG